MTGRDDIEHAITVLEEHRAVLSDKAVDTAVSLLRDRLARINTPDDRRRLVTVLFADVSGFTTMSERMDPEHVNEAMNALWAALDTVAVRFGGRVDKHMGDAVMCVWGDATTKENDAEQAVRAALAMQAEVRSVYEKRRLPVPLKICIGLNTGRALVGRVGTSDEYSAIGDTVNTAARLEQEADPGQILLSDETYRHVRGTFAVRKVGSVKLKGKRKALTAYEVTREVKAGVETHKRGVNGARTALIGRREHIDSLWSTFVHVDREAAPQWKVLIGEAGIGKTRLIREFVGRLNADRRGLPILFAGATPESPSFAFSVIKSMFSAHFGISDADTAREVRTKFQRGFRGTERNVHIVARVLGFQYAEHPDERGPAASNHEIVSVAEREIAGFLARLAGDTGFVLIMEDLHWFDSASLRTFTRGIADMARGRAFFLGSARPDFATAHPPESTGYLPLRVEPLTDGEVEELIGQLQLGPGEPPADIRETIVTYAQGNPYYVEEFIRTVRERMPDADTGEEKPVPIGLPTTLEGIILSRIDALDPGEQKIIRWASAVGRRFWDAAVGGNAPNEPAFATLVDRQMIFPREPSVFPDAHEYVFKHNLLRDVAYESILKRDRPGIHSAVAHWLMDRTEQRAGEFAGIIAWHLSRSGEVDAERRYLGIAGLHSLSQGALDDAVRSLSRAIDLVPETADYRELFDLVLARERAHDLMGARTAQKRDIDALTGIAEKSEDSRCIAEAHLRTAAFLESTGRYTEALDHAKPAAEIAQANDDTGAAAEAFYWWGRSLWRLSRYEEAHTALEQAMSSGRAAGRLNVEGNSLRTRGSIAMMQDDHEGARDDFRRALRLYREIGDRRGEATTVSNLGIVEHGAGNYDAALSMYETSKRLFAEIGDRRGESRAFSNIADLRCEVGQYARAQDDYRRALAISEEIHDKQSESWILSQLALLLRDTGEPENARENAERAESISRSIGAEHELAHALNVLGSACLAASDPHTADRCFREAAAIRTNLGEDTLRAESLSGLVETELLHGRRESAAGILDDILPKITTGILSSAQEPFLVYLRCYRALRALDDPRAARVLDRANRALNDRASKISNAKNRRAFIYECPARRAIVEEKSGDCPGPNVATH